jgi:hypothetical protein
MSRITMKPLLILLAVTVAARAEDFIPKAFDKARYAETVGKSPFVLETKVEAVKEPDRVSPFANLYLRGITKDPTGKDSVLLQRLGEERAIRLIGTETGDDGLSVKAVKVGSNFRETSVTLMKGMEMGEVKFKEESLNSPPPAAPGAKGPGGLPMPTTKPGSPMPTGMPPFPGARPPTTNAGAMAIPRPQVPVPTPIAAPQAPGAPRQRVRVINN